jgi:predicted AAA+ superfamily ATPase
VLLRDTLLNILKDQDPPAVPGREVERERAPTLSLRAGRALVLTGVRRSGKTILQAQLIRDGEEAFYCNFEDTRLYGLSPEDFPTWLSLVDELSPRGVPVFLDEVQEVPEWQRLVRSLLDRHHPVCVTGSNASLLGRELGTKLTGRHLSFEVFPFRYSEYLTYTRRRAGAPSLTSYLNDGGFPAFVRERDPQILQELLRDIVQRDITARHGLRETRHVMNLALFLLANTGQPLSMQSLTKALKIPSVAQTGRYLEFLEDAYLLFAVPKFSPSFRKRVVTPNKYFAIDNGLRRVNSPQTSPDSGHRLENAVFLALRRRGHPVSYAGEKDVWECDFVTPSEAIQVCAELTPHNRAREMNGLLGASTLRGKRRLLIITLDQRDRVTVEGKSVDIIPAWEWLADTARKGLHPTPHSPHGGGPGSHR